MSASGLDQLEQATAVPALEKELQARSGIAADATRRAFRAIRQAWRFAHACARLAQLSDESAATRISDSNSLLHRASADDDR